MSQLTDISVQFRKIAMYAGIGLVVIFVLQLIVRLIISSLSSPPGLVVEPVVPSPTPDMRFGKLPYPKFSVVQQTSAGLNLELINIEGKPPEVSGTATVFSMPKKLPSLLTNDRAAKFAGKLGYIGTPQVLDSRRFFYIHPTDPLLSLTLDRVMFNFLLKFDWQKDPQRVFGPLGIDQNTATRNLMGFIQEYGLFDDSILRGKATHQPLVYNGSTNTLAPVQKTTQANAFRMDFFRTNIGDLTVLPPGFDTSPVYAIYTPSTSLRKGVLEIGYTFWPIAPDDGATYPLRTSDAAWKDLQDGFGTVVRLGQNNPEKVIVRQIYLAYLDTPDPQPYLQPIFVFTGDNGFVAYLPAITKEYLE